MLDENKTQDVREWLNQLDEEEQLDVRDEEKETLVEMAEFKADYETFQQALERGNEDLVDDAELERLEATHNYIVDEIWSEELGDFDPIAVVKEIKDNDIAEEDRNLIRHQNQQIRDLHPEILDSIEADSGYLPGWIKNIPSKIPDIDIKWPGAGPLEDPEKRNTLYKLGAVGAGTYLIAEQAIDQDEITNVTLGDGQKDNQNNKGAEAGLNKTDLYSVDGVNYVSGSVFGGSGDTVDSIVESYEVSRLEELGSELSSNDYQVRISEADEVEVLQDGELVYNEQVDGIFEDAYSDGEIDGDTNV